MMVYCPRCDTPMQVQSCDPLTCYCHPCAFKVIFTFSLTDHTTALTLVGNDRTWDELPAKTVIPRAFYEAFEGDEVNEP